MPRFAGDVDSHKPDPYIATDGETETRFVLLWRARGTGKRNPSHIRVRHA